MKKVKFAYKHPIFGRTSKVKATEPYKNSVYYYWWEFLRLNEDYKKCCERGGKGKLSRLYKDFGDVFSVDFKTWWQTCDRGASLFAEKLPPSFSVVPAENIHEQDDVLYLRLPLALPKRFLVQEFQRILNKHHHGARGKRTNEQSTAMYPVTGHVDIGALDKCLRVFVMKSEQPDLYLWQIGHFCKLTKRSNLNKGTELAVGDKMILANTVKRLLNRAEKIINGVAEGKFPVTV